MLTRQSQTGDPTKELFMTKLVADKNLILMNFKKNLDHFQN